MRDIADRKDVNLLVDKFYKEVIADEVIGYLFTEVVVLDWEKHIPIMYNFWETILFSSGNYTGNPIIKHVELNKKEPLQPEHFERWIKLWEDTVNNHFQGPVADEAIKRANLMAELMLQKISNSRNNNFIQ